MAVGMIGDFFKFLVSLFVDKAWEQMKLEDTVEDADPVLETIEVEVDRSVDLDDDLDSEFDAWMSNSDSDAVRSGKQAA